MSPAAGMCAAAEGTRNNRGRTGNRIVQLLTNDIHGYQGKWATSSCIPYSKGVIEEVKPINAPLTFNSSKLNSFYYKAHTLFTSVGFTPIVSSRTNLCIK